LGGILRSKNENALKTLLAYSAYDAPDIEALMALAYNLELNQTRFEESNQLIPLKLREIPFNGDIESIINIVYESLS